MKECHQITNTICTYGFGVRERERVVAAASGVSHDLCCVKSDDFGCCAPSESDDFVAANSAGHDWAIQKGSMGHMQPAGCRLSMAALSEEPRNFEARSNDKDDT
ncbi:hypothetical protein TNCV_336681 [Trichonephila clavipes]|nr:hypothetical protein TNCV_336681 [Trichonephila clavipes]